MTIVEATIKRVENLMKEKGISQKELEEKSKISHYCMNKLLLCKYKDIDARIIYKLCKAYGISICEFFDDNLFDFNNLEINITNNEY